MNGEIWYCVGGKISSANSSVKRSRSASGHPVVLAEQQRVQPGAGQAVQCPLRCAGDRLAFQVERGVDQDRDTGAQGEGAQHASQERVLLPIHGLNSCGVIHVHHGRDTTSGKLGDRNRERHKRAGLVEVEIVPGVLGQHDRDKRSERFVAGVGGYTEITRMVPVTVAALGLNVAVKSGGRLRDLDPVRHRRPTGLRRRG